MRRIRFNPEALSAELKKEWDDWQDRAEAACLKAIEEWETWKTKKQAPTLSHQNGQKKKKGFEPDFESQVWSHLKQWLLANVFCHKCAYCETKIVRNSGDAEHYRPKGRVSFRPSGDPEMKAQVVKVKDETGAWISHPGYFWLAYNWKNLLPSCEYCNRGVGKKDSFPVNKTQVFICQLTENEVAKLKAKPFASSSWRGWFYLQPEDLDSLEEPLLLHPYNDEPSRHLVFGDKGTVAARDGDQRGLTSIAVYALDDEMLRAQRQIFQERAKTNYFGAYFTSGTTDELKQKARDMIKEFVDGTEAYSAAALDYLRLLNVPLE